MKLKDQVVYILTDAYPGLSPVQFGFQECAPGHNMGPCTRRFLLLHYVISGTGKLQINGETYTVSPGEIFVVPKGVKSYYEADQEDPWHYIWIGFYYDDIMPNVFTSPVMQIPGAGEIFNDMRRCQNMGDGRSAFLAGKIWELIANALNAQKQSTDYIDQALTYIATAYMHDINVGQLADALNLDRCYFSTLFHKRMGITPGRYLTNYRLEKALELMRVHGESPATAASFVGYSDICHFSKAFKQKYGMSPRNYLKKINHL